MDDRQAASANIAAARIGHPEQAVLKPRRLDDLLLRIFGERQAHSILDHDPDEVGFAGLINPLVPRRRLSLSLADYTRMGVFVID